MLAVLTWFQYFLAFLFITTCALLILVILLQKGRGGGLSGAFGGVGGHSAFGAKTGDVFTWVTVALAAVFVLVAIIGNWKFVPQPSAETITSAVSPSPDTAKESGAASGSGQGSETPSDQSGG